MIQISTLVIVININNYPCLVDVNEVIVGKNIRQQLK